jgi:hypothetical protein
MVGQHTLWLDARVPLALGIISKNAKRLRGTQATEKQGSCRDRCSSDACDQRVYDGPSLPEASGSVASLHCFARQIRRSSDGRLKTISMLRMP